MFQYDNNAQLSSLIITGAISFYEGKGLDIPDILKAEGREDLLEVLDLILAALYWLQKEFNNDSV